MAGLGKNERRVKKGELLKQHERLINEKTSFAVREAYNALRTNLLYALAPDNGKVVLVSSANAAEGKSTTAANLALTLAQMEAKVLLIDADLRKPTQHKFFQMDNSHGISRFLVGFETLSEAIKLNVRDHLDLLSSGPIPPNPSELLGSSNMQIFIEKMKEFYDFIIIDTPPVNVVTDVAVISKVAAGVLFVSRYGLTTFDSVRKALDTLAIANAKVLGLVISDIQNANLKGRSYKYRYKYYRSYAYKHHEGYGYQKAHDDTTTDKLTLDDNDAVMTLDFSKKDPKDKKEQKDSEHKT